MEQALPFTVEKTYPSFSAFWQQVAQLPVQFLLLGDSHHGSHLIADMPRQVFSYLAKMNRRKWTFECAPHSRIAKATDSFNQASWTSRLLKHDVVDLVEDLRGVTFFWSGDEEGQEQRRAIYKQRIIEARRQKISLFYVNKNIPPLVDYLTDISKETRQRLVQLMEYRRLNKNSWPDYYNAAPLLRITDNLLLDKAMKACDADNLGYDCERARQIQTLANDQPIAVFYGAGHYRGAGDDGIDAFLPLNEQAQVLIIDSTIKDDTSFWQRYRSPHFIYDAAQQKGWATPLARNFKI